MYTYTPLDDNDDNINNNYHSGRLKWVGLTNPRDYFGFLG